MRVCVCGSNGTKKRWIEKKWISAAVSATFSPFWGAESRQKQKGPRSMAHAEVSARWRVVYGNRLTPFARTHAAFSTGGQGHRHPVKPKPPTQKLISNCTQTFLLVLEPSALLPTLALGCPLRALFFYSRPRASMRAFSRSFDPFPFLGWLLLLVYSCT